MRCFPVNSATAQAAMLMICCHCVAFSPALGRSPNFPYQSTYFHALTFDKRRAHSVAAVRPFCPSRRVFSSPQRKVCIAAAVVGSHSTLFHAQPSQSSRTISDSIPTIPPRALSTRTSAHFFFHNLYSPSLPAISNQILHASC